MVKFVPNYEYKIWIYTFQRVVIFKNESIRKLDSFFLENLHMATSIVRMA